MGSCLLRKCFGHIGRRCQRLSEEIVEHNDKAANIEEKCQELFGVFVRESPTDALAWVTANFVGLLLLLWSRKEEM